MRAGRVYELKVARGGSGPAFMADPNRFDTVEVVEIASGEVVLFWDALPGEARRLARALREDLAQLDADAFVAAWRDAQPSLE